MVPVWRRKSLRLVKKLSRYIYDNYSSSSRTSGPLSVSDDACMFWEDAVKKRKPLDHNQLIGGSFRGAGAEVKVTPPGQYCTCESKPRRLQAVIENGSNAIKY